MIHHYPKNPDWQCELERTLEMVLQPLLGGACKSKLVGPTMNIRQLSRARTKTALELHYGSPPNANEIRALEAIGWLETNDSLGWALTKQSPLLDPNNMTANQCGDNWKGPSFKGVDTHPNKDGSSTKYPADFRKYPVALAETDDNLKGGWNDSVRTVFINRQRNAVKLAAAAGNFHRVSELLKSTGFYEGFGSTNEQRIAHHFAAFSGAIASGDKACNEEPLPRPDPKILEIPPTIRLGDKGPVVKRAQWELQVAADSDFGPITQAAVIEYERTHGLIVDSGIIGPQMWHALFTDGYEP
jgi:hypothetical protein